MAAMFINKNEIGAIYSMRTSKSVQLHQNWYQNINTLVKKMPLFWFPYHNNNTIWDMHYTEAMLNIRINFVPFIHVLQDLVHLMARLMKQQI